MLIWNNSALTSSIYLSKSSPNLVNLRIYLENLRKEYSKELLFSDPLKFPRRYKTFEDREISALISALFAYGKVLSIENFLEKIHIFLGDSPYKGILKNKRWKNGGYRFQSEKDVDKFLKTIHIVVKKYSRLENLFASLEGSPEEKLENFVRYFRKLAKVDSFGLDHLLSLPSKHSPAKRWRLFLRWVVRKDDGLDLGLWTTITPADLIIPLDTHIAKTALALGLTKRKTKDLKFAQEVTEKLKTISKNDPLKYDFALVREGILKNYLKECPDEDN